MRKLGLALIVGVLLQACAEPGAEPAVHYQSVRALSLQAQTGYTVDRIFVGEVTARQQTDIGFELPGSITDLAVAEGDVVAAGAVMASLDTRLLLLEQRELQASLAQTNAQLALAQRSLQRQQELKISGFTAEQRIDELNSEVKTLSATVAKLAAALEANTTRQEKASLLAPFDGVVSRRYVDAGAVVGAGVPVIQLLQSGAMQVEVGVPVRIADQLQKQVDYPVVVNAVAGAASVNSIGANISAGTRTVPVWFGLSGINARDGELAAITLGQQFEHPGFWVPFAAVTEGMRGTWVVYGLSPDNDGLHRVQRHAVEILYAAGAALYVSGELANIEIVSGGLHRIVPGQLVRVSERVNYVPE